ncbi:phosphotransferase family protein [Mycoplasmopsis meleagridis]|uniref:phosphotransferase family protein n=1 Tax=Mycoplasmopsis meleagridis TaxID=29561 RepID=UPI003A83D2EE
MKQRITKGYTNKSYYKNNIFWQKKIINGFNHRIKYKILKKLPFLPKLLSNNRITIKWSYINGLQPELSKENLKILAKELNYLHNSSLSFPKANYAQRINFYLSIMQKRNIKIATIEKINKLIKEILSNNSYSFPLHNDLRMSNFIKKDEKIYIVDWEYASMGDNHFDLAYLIEANFLNNEQENYFIEQYGKIDYKKLIENKILVNYLIILWVNAQKKLVFAYDYFIDKIEKELHILEKLKNTP